MGGAIAFCRKPAFVYAMLDEPINDCAGARVGEPLIYIRGALAVSVAGDDPVGVRALVDDGECLLKGGVAVGESWPVGRSGSTLEPRSSVMAEEPPAMTVAPGIGLWVLASMTETVSEAMAGGAAKVSRASRRVGTVSVQNTDSFSDFWG